MKKLIVLAACLGTAVMALGQGAVNFNTKVSSADINAPVDDGLGNLLSGDDGWQAQLLYSDTEGGAMMPVGSPVAFRTGNAVGYVSGGSVDFGLPIGTDVWVQMVAWNQSAGEYMPGALNTGASNIIPVTLDGPPGTPPNLVGIQGFSLIVPEPSTMALGLLGAAALMLRRRR